MRIKILKKIGSVISLSTYRKIILFLKHYVLGLFKKMDENNTFFAGAGISFSLLIGVIPFLLLIFSLLGNIFDQSVIEIQVNNFIDQTIPYPAYANYIKRTISSRLPEFIEYKTLAGYVGVFGLLFTSTWIFSSIRTILNHIYHVNIQKGFLYGLLRDVLMVILLVIIITIFVFIVPALNIIYELTKNYDFFQSYTQSSLWNILVHIVSFILLFGLFFGLYYLIPYEQLGKKVAAVSAFWSLLLWEISRSVFGYYINNILSTNPLYGAFVLIIAIQLWLYCSACIFIVGAEIGQLYRERKSSKIIKRSDT